MCDHHEVLQNSLKISDMLCDVSEKEVNLCKSLKLILNLTKFIYQI